MREGTNDQAMWDEVYRDNVYELPDDMTGQVAVDIGAHIGSFALAVLDRGGRAYSAEPCLGSAEELQARRAGRTRRWHFRAVAVVGKAEKPTALMCCCPEPGMHSGDTLCLHPELKSDQVVILTTLDEFCSDIGVIDFLKLDCEGSEYDILIHSHATLLRVKKMAVEFHRGLGPQNPARLMVDALAAAEAAGLKLVKQKKQVYFFERVADAVTG